MFESIRHRQGLFEKLWYIYGQRIHRWMLAEDANFYLKPNDIISHRPTLFGMHEPHIEKLITEASREFGGFLLDLGANIGLTSALTGAQFRRVDCVEPNELVVNILKTNLALNLPDTDFEIHPVGLGQGDDRLTLRVPTDNFGGAHLKKGNRLFEGQSASGDIRVDAGAAGNTSRFFECEVEIKDASSWLAARFAALSESGLNRGVIKIDVEGYEETIFTSILKSLPADFEAVVIMENWFDHFPVSSFASKAHRMDWFYFQKQRRILHSIPFKLLGLSSSYESVVLPLDDETPKPHDVICVLRRR